MSENFPELTTIGQSFVESLIFDPVISTEFSSGHNVNLLERRRYNAY